MKRKRNRKYSKKFKSHAVTLVFDEGKSINSAAKHLSMPKSTLAEWIKKEKSEAHADDAILQEPGAEQSELELRREELATVRAESDVVKRSERPNVSCVTEQTDLVMQENTFNVVGPYDPSLLDRARQQWQHGDWESLVDIAEIDLGHHPDRAKLALLAAAGYQQLDDMDNCKKYVRIARQLGCDNQIIARLLLAGVHNSLGKLAALKKDDEKTRSHFGAAVNLRMSGKTQDLNLARHARSVKEIAKLGLLAQAAELIDVKVSNLGLSRLDSVKQQASIALLKNQQQELLFLTRDNAGIRKKTGRVELLILVASIPRSGSTWLYNCVKQLLQTKYKEIYSCWTEDYEPENQSPIHVVKVHYPDPDLAQKADIIISTRRDIRDVAASLVRMKWDEKGDKFIEELSWIVNTVHPFWNVITNLEIEYHQIIKSPEYIVEQVGHTLGIHISPRKAKQISLDLANMKTPDRYDKNTQLHPNHRAMEPTHYSKLLGKDRAELITNLFIEWLIEFDYLKFE